MFSGFPDPSVPGAPSPWGDRAGWGGAVWCNCGPGEWLHCVKCVNARTPGVTVTVAAAMSLQRSESEGNRYLVSLPLLAKIPKDIKGFAIYDLQSRG